MDEVPDKLLEVYGILEKYVKIHDEVFKFSWRKVIPVPGIFKSVNYEKHASDLSCLVGDIEKMSLQEQRNLPTIFPEYVRALCNAISALRDICKKLHDQSQKVGSYPPSQYKRDVERYNLLAANYRNLGNRLNQYVRNPSTDNRDPMRCDMCGVDFPEEKFSNEFNICDECYKKSTNIKIGQANMKKQITEREAVEQLLKSIEEGTYNAWPEVKNYLADHHKVTFKNQELAYLNLLLAALSQENQALSNFFSKEQKDRILNWELYYIPELASQYMKSTEYGEYAKEELKRYQEAWKLSIESKVNPAYTIVRMILDRWSANEIIDIALINFMVILLIDKVGIGRWKNIREKYDLIEEDITPDDLKNLDEDYV